MTDLRRIDDYPAEQIAATSVEYKMEKLKQKEW